MQDPRHDPTPRLTQRGLKARKDLSFRSREKNVSQIDEAILSVTATSWRKVALVIAMAEEILGNNLPDLIADRIEALIHDGRPLAQGDKNGGATGCGKDARWKSPKADFPTSLGNPANGAGFPLSHSPGDCCHQLKPDKSRAKKTGRFNLLTTDYRRLRLYTR